MNRHYILYHSRHPGWYSYFLGYPGQDVYFFQDVSNWETQKVTIRRTASRYIAESITTDAGRFGQLHTKHRCLYLKPVISPLFSTFCNYNVLLLCTIVCRLNSWIVKYVHLGAWKCNQKVVIVFKVEMGHSSRWHTSKLSTKKWHYTELPWIQLMYRIRRRSSYSFIISWAVWRNASRFKDNKEKHFLGTN